MQAGISGLITLEKTIRLEVTIFCVLKIDHQNNRSSRKGKKRLLVKGRMRERIIRIGLLAILFKIKDQILQFENFTIPETLHQQMRQ